MLEKPFRESGNYSEYSSINGRWKNGEINFEGFIKEDTNKKNILIKYTEKDSISLSIANNGSLSNFPEGYSNGSFKSTDTINLYINQQSDTSRYTHSVYGFKLK